MILGYKRGTPAAEAYHYGKIDGQDRKFVRVVAGVVLPQLDREKGAAVVVGEMFRVYAPADLTVLEVVTGPWSDVENGLKQAREDLKFSTVIVDREANRAVVYRIPGVTTGLNEVPCASYAAPEYALSEIGREKTDRMATEGRLHISPIMRDKMESGEMDQAAKALFCCVCWIQERAAIYKPTRPAAEREKHYLGARGL